MKSHRVRAAYSGIKYYSAGDGSLCIDTTHASLIEHMEIPSMRQVQWPDHNRSSNLKFLRASEGRDWPLDGNSGRPSEGYMSINFISNWTTGRE